MADGEHAEFEAPLESQVSHYKRMYDVVSAMAKIGVWECELPTDALTWTDTVYDLFELPRGSPVDRLNILDFYEENSRQEMERLRAEIIANGGSFELDIAIRTARGNRKWLRLCAIADQVNGRSVRIFGTKQDITPTKLAQERVHTLQLELVHASRRSAMGAMAATFAHELNQPLAAIANYAAGCRRVMNASVPDREALQIGLDHIEKSALSVGGIIRGLRSLTEGRLKRRKFDVRALISEAVDMAQKGAPETVSVDCDTGDAIIVVADRQQIQLALLNILKNAVEAAAEGHHPVVAVATMADDQFVQITIEDSGPGIAADMVKTLYAPFVSSKPDGMGIGLSITRTIIEAHGGILTASNRESGGGVLFFFPSARLRHWPRPRTKSFGVYDANSSITRTILSIASPPFSSGCSINRSKSRPKY